MTEPRYSWTQPACAECYSQRFPGIVRPSALVTPEPERCVYCGGITVDGLYVRIDPAEATYPTNLK